MKYRPITVFIFFALFINSFASNKCGTPDAIRRFFAEKRTQQPPSLPLRFETAHFVLHYDTTGENAVYSGDENGNFIPDYVESTAIFLENVWHKVVDSLGYRPPLADTIGTSDTTENGGDARTDIYFDGALGSSVYGMTYPLHQDSIDGSWKATVYIEIQPDMTRLPGYEDNPYPPLKVTCAHEFFHAVQFAYRLSMSTDFIWWSEATAVFNEEVCFDDVNDYYNYLHIFQNSPRTPLFSYDTDENIWYGAVMFPIFLAEYFSSPDRRFYAEAIRQIWEEIEHTSPEDALDEFLGSRGTSTDEILKKFLVWRARVGELWNENFYAEGESYPLPEMDSVDVDDGEITLSDSLRALSCSYYCLPYELEDAGIVAELFDVEFPAQCFLGLVPVEIPGALVPSISFTDGAEQLAAPGRWQYRTIVLPALVSSFSQMQYANFKVSISEEDSLSIPVAAQNKIGNPYPNPCGGERIIFPLEIAQPTDVSLMIYSASGEPVWSAQEKYEYPQPADIVWECRNFSGKRIAAGVYIFIAKTIDGEKRGKILIVR
ncbi:T9SS type A sorting domain-containing protein [bacterium]|nr:T9SS type A sorting domain-containing protein [bacterium]